MAPYSLCGPWPKVVHYKGCHLGSIYNILLELNQTLHPPGEATKPQENEFESSSRVLCVLGELEASHRDCGNRSMQWQCTARLGNESCRRQTGNYAV